MMTHSTDSNSNEFKITTQSIFRCIIFDNSPTLSEVIKAINWGSNRDIRQKGFKVDTLFSKNTPFFSGLVKHMNKIKDPNHIVKDGQAVLTIKGDRVVVVRVKS